MDPPSISVFSVAPVSQGNWTETVSHATPPRQTTIAIVGPGRLGVALAGRLRGAGHIVTGPFARGYDVSQLTEAEAVLLCVPDREIPVAAAYLAEGLTAGTRCPLVGHCSGACTLDVLEPFADSGRFSLHPLMTFAAECAPSWKSATAVLAGSTPHALGTARKLALDLGLTPLALDEDDRAAYHAAASMASNFLITLELAAERLAASAGVPRDALAPLVRQTVENWAARGSAALTGPIARGDTDTVARQRDAIAERTPELLRLFDELARSTHELAHGTDRSAVAAGSPPRATELVAA
jgi:predicted short-subunit dehydrogenase-like oxidoreductase (DUF2520 family)